MEKHKKIMGDDDCASVATSSSFSLVGGGSGDDGCSIVSAGSGASWVDVAMMREPDGASPHLSTVHTRTRSQSSMSALSLNESAPESNLHRFSVDCDSVMELSVQSFFTYEPENLPHLLDLSNKWLHERYLGAQTGLHGRSARRRCHCSMCKSYSSQRFEVNSSNRERTVTLPVYSRNLRSSVTLFEVSAMEVLHPFLANRTNLNKAKGWEAIPKALVEDCNALVLKSIYKTRSQYVPTGFQVINYAVPIVGHIERLPLEWVDKEKKISAYSTRVSAEWKNWKPNTYYRLVRHVPKFTNHNKLLPWDANELANSVPASACVVPVIPIPLDPAAVLRRKTLQPVRVFSMQTFIRGKNFAIEPGTHIDSSVFERGVVTNELSQLCSITASCTWSSAWGQSAHNYVWALCEAPLPRSAAGHREAGRSPVALNNFDDWHLTLDLKRPTMVVALSVMGRAPRVKPFPLPDPTEPARSRRARDLPTWPVIDSSEAAEQFVKRMQVSVFLDEANKWISLGDVAVNVDAISEAHIELPGGPYMCRRIRLRPLSRSRDGYTGPGPAMRVGVWAAASSATSEAEAHRAQHGEIPPGHVAYSMLTRVHKKRPSNDSVEEKVVVNKANANLVTGRDIKRLSARSSGYYWGYSNSGGSRKAKMDGMRFTIAESLNALNA